MSSLGKACEKKEKDKKQTTMKQKKEK